RFQPFKGEGKMIVRKNLSSLRDFPRCSWRLAAALSAVTLVCGASEAMAQVDKDAAMGEMFGIAEQMHGLKALAATDPASASAYALAESRYRSLSLALGGDDPAHVAHAFDQSQALSNSPDGSGGFPPGCTTVTPNFANTTPLAIPTGPAVVTSTITVTGAATYLLDLDLNAQLAHTFANDLDVTLTSPAGTVVTLTTDNGAGNDNVFDGTVWNDSANPAGQVPYVTNNGMVTDHAYVNLATATPLVPEEAFGAFIGEDPNGTWTLTISDDLAGDGGNLASWSLDITTLPNAPIITTVPTATQATPTAIPTGPGVATSTILVSAAGTAIH